MITLWLWLTPDVAADQTYLCGHTSSISIGLSNPGNHYFECPESASECSYSVQVQNISEAGASFTLAHAGGADSSCTVLLYPRSTDGTMFELKPSSGTASLTIQDIQIGANPDSNKKHENYIVRASPDPGAFVNINFVNVVVTGQQNEAKSFISASDGTTVSILDSSISWSSAGTAKAGGTFYLTGGSLTITNSLLYDAVLLLTEPTISGHLLYASDSDTSDDKDTTVTVSNSVILAGSSGDPASLMQLEDTAALSINDTLVRAGANSNATTIIDLTGESSASLTNTLIVGEEDSGLVSLFGATKNTSLTLSATTLDLNTDGARALPELGTLALTNVVMTGIGNLDIGSGVTQSNVYVSSYADGAESLALGPLADLNASVPSWASLEPVTRVCWDENVAESCVETLEIWPSLCSPTWGEGSLSPTTPAGFLYGASDSPRWPSQLTTLAAWWGDAWYAYHETESDPANPKWEEVPCYDSASSLAACQDFMTAAPGGYRPTSWLKAEVKAEKVSRCHLVEDSTGTDDGTSKDSGGDDLYDAGGPGCRERTTSAAALLFSGLGGLLALRRRRAA